MIRRAIPADAEALGRMHVRAWRETYPGIVPFAVLDALDAGNHAARWRERLGGDAIVHIAEHQGDPVGFASAGPQADPDLFPGVPATIQTLYVLRAGQRRGFGRGLMAALAADLIARGLPGANLWVLAGNHAAEAFYAALGGQRGPTRSFTEGDWTGVDTAYLWPDLAHLLPTG